MGFFKILGMVTENWLNVKNLDTGSDIHIANICKFEPLRVPSHIKNAVTEYVKQSYLNGGGLELTVLDVAALKLIFYSEIYGEQDGPEYDDIQKGLKSLMVANENDIRADIRLQARVALAI